MKTLKNILKPKTLITLIAMMTLCVLTTSIFASSPTAFKDVPASYWGYKNIQRAYTDGVVSGSSYNEATGERYYSPEDKVTMAEFCTIITRAFYTDELAASTAEGSWYAAAQDVVSSHRMDVGYFNAQDASVMNGAARRYDMAGLVYSVLKDKNVTLPTDAELTAVQSKIADWSDMNRIDRQYYQKAVSTVVALGLITGKDDKGTFAGMDNLTRAEVATIYCRLADLINGNPVEKPVTPEKPDIPEKPEQPTEKPATGNYGAVGTLSDTPVTLSFSTHKPVVDYWSRTSAEVQAATEKDVFNAAVQTLKDRELQMSVTTKMIASINPNYNYACFNYDSSNQKQINVTAAVGSMGGYRVYSVARALNNADDTNLAVITCYGTERTTRQDDVFLPILARLNDSMTDMQKAEILVQAVTDRFDYGTGAMFDWLSENRVGDCDNYARAVDDLFNAAGIVCYNDIGGDTAYGVHAWNRAYLDGQWYAVDATTAETGAHSTGIMTYTEHANLFGYDMDRYDYIQYKIKDALCNAVLNQ